MKLNRIIGRTADLGGIERMNVLVASVYFLNRALTEDKFLDESNSGPRPGRSRRSHRSDGCVRLFAGPRRRGKPRRSRRIRGRRFRVETRRRVPKVGLQNSDDTNIVFFSVTRALCGPDPAKRREAYAEIKDAQGRFRDVEVSGLDELASYQSRRRKWTSISLNCFGIASQKTPVLLRARGQRAGQLRLTTVLASP